MHKFDQHYFQVSPLTQACTARVSNCCEEAITTHTQAFRTGLRYIINA